MSKANLRRIITQFAGKKILVIGDVMLDKFVWGSVSRISPEAPVPIVNVEKESYAPGGAANVATNIQTLGGSCTILGIAGNDDTKEYLVEELSKKDINTNGIISEPNKPTILKVRVIGRNQHIIRFDYEKKGSLSQKTEQQIKAFFDKTVDDVDAIIISDYAKGVITKDIMHHIIIKANEKNKIIVVDPKPQHKSYYHHVTLMTPNHKEAHQMTGIEEEGNVDGDIEKLGNALTEKEKCNVLITRGEKGMSLFEKDGTITHIPTYAKEVYDIVGAGDTSIASITLALASGASLQEAAEIGNYAAGIAVAKIGTSTVSVGELRRSMEHA